MKIRIPSLGLGDQRLNAPAPSAQRPILAALERSVVEFAKAGLAPSDVAKITLKPQAFDALLVETAHYPVKLGRMETGQINYMELLGLGIERA